MNISLEDKIKSVKYIFSHNLEEVSSVTRISVQLSDFVGRNSIESIDPGVVFVCNTKIRLIYKQK